MSSRLLQVGPPTSSPARPGIKAMAQPPIWSGIHKRRHCRPLGPGPVDFAGLLPFDPAALPLSASVCMFISLRPCMAVTASSVMPIRSISWLKEW